MKGILDIFVSIKWLFMGIKFGEIDANQILENEVRLGILENVIDLILSKNKNIQGITKEELEIINKRVEEQLQKKYPKSGIKINRG